MKTDQSNLRFSSNSHDYHSNRKHINKGNNFYNVCGIIVFLKFGRKNYL